MRTRVVPGTICISSGTTVSNMLTGEKLAWPGRLVTTAYRVQDRKNFLPYWWFYHGEGMFNVEAAQIRVLKENKPNDSNRSQAFHLPSEGLWMQNKNAERNRKQMQKQRVEKRRRIDEKNRKKKEGKG